MFTSIIRKTAQGASTEWSVALAYGAPQPAGGVGIPSGALSGMVQLRANPNTSGELLAPFAGTVNVHPPTGGLLSNRQNAAAVYIAALDGTSPLTLYLTPTLKKNDDKYQSTVRRLAGRYLDADAVVAEGDRVVDFVECVVLANVDATSVKAALIPNAISIQGNTRAARAADADWANFLLGKKPISIRAGTLLGSVPASLTFGVGVLTSIGLVDPRPLFEAAVTEGYVDAADVPGVQELLALLPVSQPAIATAAAVNAVGADKIYRWPDLMAWRAVARPGWADWRGVADRQKALIAARLARRARSAGQAARFVFNEEDARNPLQLEAIAEFYLNFPEPDDQQAALPAPQAAGYRALDFTDLFGRAAQAQGTVITLDGSPNLARVVCGRDVLELDRETARPRKQFRIMGIDSANSVVVDQAPTLSAGSPWRILQDPVLVLIDDGGARVTGALARQTGPTELTLEGLSETEALGVERSNRFYDTIALIDAPAGQPSDFRIVDVAVTRPQGQPAQALITLDRDPVLQGGATSRWAIPAGLGGHQVPVPWSRPAQSTPQKWYDQYDGRLFVVAGDRIPVVLPWTSLTSRKESAAYLSSLDGNRHYRVTSALTKKHNTTFKVVDAQALARGNSAVSAGPQSPSRIDLDLTTLSAGDYHKDNGWMLRLLSATPPRSIALPLFVSDHKADLPLGQVYVGKTSQALRPTTPTPYWLELYDGVRQAAFYFGETVTPDEASLEPPTAANTRGKCGIRMHVGSILGTGSRGCLVSPWYWSFRNIMTSLHERRHRTYYVEHPEADQIDKVNDGTDDPPPIVMKFLDAAHRVDYLVAQLGVLEGAVREASQRAAEVGGDELVMVVEEVSRIVSEIQSRQAANPKHGDGVEPDRLADLLDELAELFESASAAPIDELRDTPITGRLASLASLKGEIATARQVMQAEEDRVGWAHALQSDLYIIRPHERRIG